MQLKKLRNLKELDLRGAANLTDDVAAQLFGEETLVSRVYLVQCPKFTDEGLLRLSTKLEVRHMCMPSSFVLHDLLFLVGASCCRRRVTGNLPY